MQKTKAQLEEELRDAKSTIAKQTSTIEDTLKLDEAQRKELTIALGRESLLLEDTEGPGFTLARARTREAGPLSWSQIFVEVGRLLEMKSKESSSVKLRQLAREASGLLNKYRYATGDKALFVIVDDHTYVVTFSKHQGRDQIDYFEVATPEQVQAARDRFVADAEAGR